MLAAVQAGLAVMFPDPAAGIITSENANTLGETPETALSCHGVTGCSLPCEGLCRILLSSYHSKSSSVSKLDSFQVEKLSVFRLFS